MRGAPDAPAVKRLRVMASKKKVSGKATQKKPTLQAKLERMPEFGARGPSAAAAQQKERAEREEAFPNGEEPTLPPIPDRRCGTPKRIAYIVAVMAAGQWNGYVTRAKLAEAWGISDSRVRQYSAEASRMLYADDDPEELAQKRRSLAAWVAAQRERAARMTSFVTGLPDFGAALKATELEAKLLGIEFESKRRVELTGKNGGPVDLTGGLAALFAEPDDEEPVAKEQVPTSGPVEAPDGSDRDGSDRGPATPDRGA